MVSSNNKEMAKQNASNSTTMCQRINNEMWETVVALSITIGGWRYTKPSPEDISRVSEKMRRVIELLNNQANELDYVEDFFSRW